ncbi:trans-sialidase [Trypanosoma rangeli]|uniref:Trans-sialidase n=1 Tax=Trypanosoma rangeli TaxID=5698 RepID=A0A3R7JT64_TRYRA|nr:trans-sialidase [Trypanosoma rangeli]RNE96465.1 trans-sialidase [Trypanosoma rangeli]|eukprot:RNE96465.1 trans-sialidase [Trypanosoma rangeli]
MPRHLFFSCAVLICVLSICCSSTAVATSESNSNVVTDPFNGTTEVAGGNWKYASDASVTSLRVPSLVEVNGDVFAVAEAQCKNGNGSEEAVSVAGIASTHLKDISDVEKEILTAEANLFCMQFEEASDAAGKATEVMQPTTIVSGSDVYMLLGKYSRTESEPEVSGDGGWRLLLVKGTVTGDSEEKKIEWGKTHAVKPDFLPARKSLTRLVGGGGSGIVLSDGTLVFPMQAIDKDEWDGKKKNFFLSMRFTQAENKWELSRQMADVGGYKDPSIVEWGEDQKLLLMAPCKDGYYDVYESPGLEQVGTASVSQFPVCGATHMIEKGRAFGAASSLQPSRRRG